jgi:chorismate synthase
MLRFLTAGESHGPALTAIVEGLPAGLALSGDKIDTQLRRRQIGYGRGGRQQIEHDQVAISAGLAAGQTTGGPLALRIENRDWANWRDREVPPLAVPRPGHADLAGALKYGLDDVRPVLERASARETAARVAVGAVARRLLEEFDLRLGSYVAEIGGVVAQIPDLPHQELWAQAEASDIRCPDPASAQAMRQRISEARQARDSLGGVFVVTVNGVPPGLGSYVHWDRRLDAQLAWAMMSIQGVKGVEIGPAFENSRQSGTQVHDEIVHQEGRLARSSNRAGGIEGGVSNGQPIVVRAAMKPIPTTLTPLRSVDLVTGQPAMTQYQRSDVCAVPAAAVVGEAMVAWVLANALAEKIGGDSLAEMRAHWEAWSRHA